MESALATKSSPKVEATESLHQTIKSIVEGLYDPIHFGQDDIPTLMNYIRADKKNNHDNKSQNWLKFSIHHKLAPSVISGPLRTHAN